MKKALLAAFIFVLSFGGNAQQDPQFTFFMFDKLSFNPAAAGEHAGYCFNSFYRYQYGSFDYNAPRTLLINASGQFNVNHGVGLSFIQDNIGNLTTTHLRGSYAYRLPLGNVGTLAFGAMVGFQSGSMVNRWIPVQGTPDQDPNIPVNNLSDINVDASFGVYFSKQDSRDNYYAGISFTHLAPVELKDLSYSLALNMYAIGGYRFAFNGASNPQGIMAHALVKSDFNVFSFDLGAMYDVTLGDNKLMGGLTYRYSEDLNILLAWEKNLGGSTNAKLRVGYAYGYALNNYITPNSGSHEITLGFCFNPVPPIVIDPVRNVINF